MEKSQNRNQKCVYRRKSLWCSQCLSFKERIAGYLTNRAAALDAKEVQLFMESDPATQKLLNLIAILRTDRLFLSFCLMSIVKRLSWESQSWKPEMQISFSIIKKYRVPKLKRGKTQQRENFGCYFNFMVDANLLAPDGKTRRITPPILDIALERHLEAKGDSAMIKAITGVS